MRLIRDLTQIIVRWYEKSAPQKFMELIYDSTFIYLFSILLILFCFCDSFISIIIRASTWEFLMIKSKTKTWRETRKDKINLNFWFNAIAAVTTQRFKVIKRKKLVFTHSFEGYKNNNGNNIIIKHADDEEIPEVAVYVLL